MASNIEIRSMQPADLHAVLDIQAACYTQIIPESRESFESKLAASPGSCFIASVDAAIVGYLVALPWRFSSPPTLNLPACRLPAQPDCLYLHDLAVAPVARQAGAGQALVAEFFSHMEESNLVRASLIAIQDSASYWQRHGFNPVALTEPLKARLASYGSDVHYMVFETQNRAPKK